MDYFNRSSSNLYTNASLDLFNNWITQNFGSEYSFQKVVLASPQELNRLIKLFDSFNTKPDLTRCSILKKFYTDVFSNSRNIVNGYGSYILVEKLGVTVCPYCNRNFIHNIEEDNGEFKRTCELDHFYPKDKYPFLSLSFYNLIPSCKVCNKLKGAKIIGLNPYDETIDWNNIIKFRANIVSHKYYYDKDGIEILVQNMTNSENVQSNIDCFHLKELYKNHNDIVFELFQKEMTYNSSYLSQLWSKYKTLFKNEETLLKHVSGYNISEEELQNRPLSKLTKDIIEENKFFKLSH